MRFLLDENFPKSVIPLLAERGDEVIELRSVGLLGASDALIAKKAIETGAVILTTDRDFFHTVPNTFAEHPGVVVIAVRQPSRIFNYRETSMVPRQCGRAALEEPCFSAEGYHMANKATDCVTDFFLVR